MRLVVLFTGLISKDYLSGGDQLFLDLAPRLPKELEIVVITPTFAKKHWQNITHPNLHFRYLPQNPFDFKQNTLFIFFSYLIRSWQTFRILKKEKKIDALYSCSDVAYGDIWPAFFYVNKSRQTNWLSRVYHVLLPPNKRPGNYLLNFLAFYLQRLSFLMMKKRSRHVLALNEKLKNELTQLGFPKNKLGILGAGIDFARINKFKPTKKYAYQAVALGRIAPVKGIFDMVDIWTRVHNHNPKWKLAWIGSGDIYTEKLKTMIKKANLQDSFNLLGFLNKKEIFNILKSSAVFLCSDHENGWGLAVCEAMSAGLPVVAYDIDIFGSVYQKGFRSSPLRNTEQFANNVIAVLEDAELRKKLSLEATSQAAEFDLDKVTADLLRFLRK